MADGAYERAVYTGCFSARTGTYNYSTYDVPALRRRHLADNAHVGAPGLALPEVKIWWS